MASGVTSTGKAPVAKTKLPSSLSRPKKVRGTLSAPRIKALSTRDYGKPEAAPTQDPFEGFPDLH